MIPARIVPFRMVRTEYFVLGALPVFASFNPMVLVESNRLNLLRFRLCTEACVLRFDLLHLLRSRLLHLGSRISLRVLLAGHRSCAGFSRRLLHALTLLALLNLLVPTVRRHSGRSRRGSICRFLVSSSLPAGSSTSTRLVRRSAGRLTRDIAFRGVRRLAARVSFSALFRTRLISGAALIPHAAFLDCATLLRWPFLRLGRVWAGLCLSRARFFWGALAL